MISDRRGLADARAMSVVLAFETARGAVVTNVSGGRDPRLRSALERLAVTPPPIASADYISVLGGETRIIEVKGRGSSGPVHVIERELDTFVAAASEAWLYVVWNTTQPFPYGLVLVQDPQRLPWVQTRVAQREPGSFRGARHERQFQCQSEEIERLGKDSDLTGLALPDKE